MQARTIRIIAGRELRECARNRWVAALTVVLAVLALALSFMGLSGLGRFEISGFGRTAASLLNLVILLVPLMGLLLGAISIAGEREQGTLVTLMAQPVTTGEVLLGKFAGASAALAWAVVIGFGASGLVIARQAGWAHLGAYLGLVALTLPLGLVHLGIGLCLSVATRRYATAIAAAVLVWLGLVFISDLGVMGTAMVLRLTPAQLLWASLANPVQVFKLAVLQVLQGNLELLGASGLYAASWLGAWLLPALIGLLAAWVAVTVSIAAGAFARRGTL